MKRDLALGVFIFVFSFSSFADDRYVVSPSRITDEELNAVAILSPSTQSVYFSSTDVHRVMQEFAIIKERFPEFAKTRDFHSDVRLFSEVIVETSAIMRTELDPIVRKRLGLKENITHFQSDTVELPDYQTQPDIKAINSIVPIESIRANYIVGKNTPLRVSSVLVSFTHIVNVPALIRRTPIEAESISRHSRIGDGTRITRCVRSTTKAEYTISFGSGDCPAGCIERETFRFEVDTESGGVRRISRGSCGQ